MTTLLDAAKAVWGRSPWVPCGETSERCVHCNHRRTAGNTAELHNTPCAWVNLGTAIADAEKRAEVTDETDWWCPKCRSYVSGETVTFEEFHEPCGAYLGGSVQDDHRAANTPPPAHVGKIEEMLQTLFNFPDKQHILSWEVRTAPTEAHHNGLRVHIGSHSYDELAAAILARLEGKGE